MLYFSRWKALATLLTALVVCLFAVPNFFSDATIKSLPAWAQRHVVLGLDLQGGSHILLEVDANYVRKGDTVITSGGLVGRVTKVVDDDQVEIEIADGVRVRQMRSMVSDVRAKGEPVKDEDAKS